MSGLLDSREASEAATLTHLTQQALSIVQGVALLHADSKSFLGRKSSIHVSPLPDFKRQDQITDDGPPASARHPLDLSPCPLAINPTN